MFKRLSKLIHIVIPFEQKYQFIRIPVTPTYPSSIRCSHINILLKIWPRLLKQRRSFMCSVSFILSRIVNFNFVFQMDDHQSRINHRFKCSPAFLIGFPIFRFDRIRWKVFQKRVVCTKFDIYVCITWCSYEPQITLIERPTWRRHIGLNRGFG